MASDAATRDYFGYAVAEAGFVDEDEVADIIVGAYYHDANGTNSGRAYVYLSQPGGTFGNGPVIDGPGQDDELGFSGLNVQCRNRQGGQGRVQGDPGPPGVQRDVDALRVHRPSSCGVQARSRLFFAEQQLFDLRKRLHQCPPLRFSSRHGRQQ